MLLSMSYEKPYAGLKVLEISQGYAGPYCAMMLAQYGAEVIKVEPPGGDWMRIIGKQAGDHTAHSIIANIGKKSLALDLKAPEGREIAQRLAAECDVLVEAARPGVAERLGLSYDQVRGGNPGVIYMSVSGFGQEGPYADRPCTDSVTQSFSGLMSVNLGPDDGMPHRVGCLVVDHLTGIYAFQAVAAALYARREETEGRFLDISLMHSMASMLAPKIAEHHLEDGNPRVLNAPTGSYRTKDGWIAVALVKEEQWPRLCAAIGRPEYADDPRFTDFESRAEHLEVLLPMIRDAIAERTTDDWGKRLRDADILSNRINDFGDWLADEQVQSANAAPMISQPGAGPTPIVHIPGTAALRDGEARSEAPPIGGDSREILAGLGLDDAAIAALVAKGVTKVGDHEAEPAA